MKAGDWTALDREREQFNRRFTTEGGKLQGLLMLMEISCQRRDAAPTAKYFAKLEELGGAARRRAIEVCKRQWPEKDF